MGRHYRSENGGVHPEIYMSDLHFYRDLDPAEYAGDDPINMAGILKWSDLRG